MKLEKYKIAVFYDNWCPLCIKVKKRIQRIDVFNLIEFTGIRNNKTITINIPIKESTERMHIITLRNNKITSGSEAFTKIALRIPILIPLFPILKVMNFLGFGPKFYDFISKNRKVLPIGS